MRLVFCGEFAGVGGDAGLAGDALHVCRAVSAQQMRRSQTECGQLAKHVGQIRTQGRAERLRSFLDVQLLRQWGRQSLQRNSILLFLIPADSEDHFQEFKILENELKEYNPELLDKDFIISISKSDLLDDELKKEIAAEFPENKQPLFFSGVTGEGTMELKDAIWKQLHG